MDVSFSVVISTSFDLYMWMSKLGMGICIRLRRNVKVRTRWVRAVGEKLARYTRFCDGRIKSTVRMSKDAFRVRALHTILACRQRDGSSIRKGFRRGGVNIQAFIRGFWTIWKQSE